jgi:hypothetical protein
MDPWRIWCKLERAFNGNNQQNYNFRTELKRSVDFTINELHLYHIYIFQI